MELVRGFQSKNQSRIKHLLYGGLGEIHNNQLAIHIPDSRALRVIARSVLLALAIVTFIIGASSSNSYRRFVPEPDFGLSDPIDAALLPILLQDLTKEGLLKPGDKALFVNGRSSDDNRATQIDPQILNDNEMVLISESDAERQSSIPDDTFDIEIASGFGAVAFIDRTLKTGGIAIVQLSNDPSKAFHKPSNYKIVYLRRFEPTIVGMKKTGAAELSPKRRLFAFSSEAKKAALKGLEDVLLEPPRAASVDSNKYLKRTKYLPDLTGDSLDGYPRRIFIDVGLKGNTGWFERNYPRRNRDFEMYKIETVSEELMGKTREVGMSEWLRKNVKEEEYVVMKAEAEVVEEMVKSKAICLVDELFLECRHQGQGGKKNKSRRAYWECLALYGRLRDEGVAVHQWWGST